MKAAGGRVLVTRLRDGSHVASWTGHGERVTRGEGDTAAAALEHLASQLEETAAELRLDAAAYRRTP